MNRNGTASFTADISESPKEVAWMKDGKQLSEVPMKLRPTSKGPRLTLDVMECGPTDAGQYAIIVTGAKGLEAKAAFSLNVNSAS